jgi:hypothetical protein
VEEEDPGDAEKIYAFGMGNNAQTWSI